MTNRLINLALMVGDRFFGLRGAFAALAGMVSAPLLLDENLCMRTPSTAASPPPTPSPNGNPPSSGFASRRAARAASTASSQVHCRLEPNSAVHIHHQ